jgi:hypothetical protein
MVRILSLVAVALLATAALGCKAEGEVGDVSSNVAAAR